MKIQYNLVAEDYIHFNLFHIKNSNTALKSLNIQRYGSPIFFIFVAIVFAIMGDLHLLSTLIPFLGLSVLWVIFYPKLFYRHVRKNVRKMFKEGKNESLLGEHAMIFMDEGFVESNAYGETNVKWSGIQEVKEDDEFIYLYNSAI
ncbi:YcxB family protein, partial [Microvirga sp. 3-52]|nr:YcxB family protein [Microvirga sp. 3-52]